MSEQGALTAQVIARMKFLRKARGWTAERLSREMTAVGVPWSRATIATMETRGRGSISVDELAALGSLFGVEPWALTQPSNCDTCKGGPPIGFICKDCGRTG